MERITRRLMVTLLLLDAVFKALVGMAVVRMLGVAAAQYARMYQIMAAAHLVAFTAAMIAIAAVLRKVDGRRQSREDPVAVLEACWRAPGQVGGVYAAHWVAVVLGAFLAFEWLAPDALPYAGAAQIAVFFVGLTVLCGAYFVAFALTSYLVDPAARASSLAVFARGGRVITSGDHIAWRLTTVALCIGLGPTFWMASLATLAQAGVPRADRFCAMTIATFIGITGFFAALCFTVLRRTMSGPILDIMAVVESVTEGVMGGRRVPSSPFDEVGRLAVGVNLMVERLEQAERDRAAVQRLEQAISEAREADRTRSEILAGMSYEIRTPMAAVQGYADLLRDERATPEDRVAYMAVIRRNSEQLLGIIEDIQDFAKLDVNWRSAERFPFSLTAVLARVAGAMRARAVERSLAFTMQCRTPIPETILGHPAQLRQILLTLIGSAIHATQRGRVAVEISLVSSEAPSLVVEICDSGGGLSAEQMNTFFLPFMREDVDAPHGRGGGSLGMVLCQRFARLLGGHIAVRSTPGVGACFTLAIPTGPLTDVRWVETVDEALPSGPALEGEISPSALRGVHVLLAEDGYDSQRLTATQLRRAGAELEVVDNGLQAVFSALAAEHTDRPFDLVLMDMQMPELNGYVATGRLRASGFRRPIIALTAHARADDQERCLAAGCDDYLSKPVDWIRLVDAIASWVPRAAQPSGGGWAPASPITPSALLDYGPLRSDYAEDPDMADLIAEFVGNLSVRADAIQTALASDERALLGRLAHQLKGAAGGYGFPSMGEAASLLESAVVSGRPREEIEALSARLNRLCWRASIPGGAMGG